MPASLKCFDELESLSRNKSRATQQQFLKRISDLFFITQSQQGKEENELFGHVMMQVIGHVGRQCRVELSQRLATAPKAPQKILNHLACDHIRVAEPVLRHAKNISDTVLLNVIDNRIDQHIHILCQRPNISEKITDALLEHISGHALLSLVGNHDASLSPSGFDRLIDLSAKNEKIRKALLQRDDKPKDCLERIKESLSFSIKSVLVDKNPSLSAERLDEMSFARAENILQAEQNLVRKTNASLDIGQIRQLNEEGDLTQYIIAGLARNNQERETIYALSLLSNLDEKIVIHLVMTAEISALGIFCKNMYFSRDSFFALLEFKAMKRRMSSHVISTTLQRYDELTYEKAVQVMRYLKERFQNMA